MKSYKFDNHSNIFGHSQPKKSDIRKYNLNLIDSFKNHYKSRGYSQHESVFISSGIDDTVRFIGAHISVLKPYFISQSIPQEGFFISQNCIRMQNLRVIHDNNIPINWGSYFTQLGSLTNPTDLVKTSYDAFDFFSSVLGISSDLIRLRVSSEDRDLVKICSDYYNSKSLEIDTNPPKYYRHKYGLDGIGGRNFNIALRNSENDGFSDVGNVIVIEQQQKPIGIELAIGSSTIMKQIYSLNHVLDIYNIQLPDVKNPIIKRKLEDCVLVSTVLFREGLRPSGTDSKERLLRKYIQAMNNLYKELDLSLDDLYSAIRSFELSEFKEDTVSKNIIKTLIRENSR